MIILIIFGCFLFVPSPMYTLFLFTLTNMYLHTLVSLFVLFNVTMAVNLTILQTTTSFSLMAYFFVFLVLILLKMGRLNDRFALLLIVFLPSLFRLLFLLAFGLNPFALLLFFLIFDQPKHVTFTLLFNPFFFRILTIILFAFSDAYVFPTPHPLVPIN
jgi:hypothetical protein